MCKQYLSHTNLGLMLLTVLAAIIMMNVFDKQDPVVKPYFTDENLFIVSSDFSHYPAYEDACKVDAKTGKAVESGDVDIEISVLTPMRRIQSLDEFELHRHGIYIRKGYRSGTFLPQVADEVNWTKEEFVGHCSQDKAGLGWDGWRDAELYVYEAIVF